MRILLCAPGVPLPPLNGARLQLVHLSGELAKRHQVCVLAYRWPDQAGEPPAGVELISLPPPARSLATGVRALARLEPPAVTRRTRAMRSAIGEQLDRHRFDVAQVQGSRLARVAPALDGLPAVLGPVEAWHLNFAAAARTGSLTMRPLRRLNERLVLRFGANAYRPYRRIVAVSEEDARAVSALDPTLRVDFIPNGVDTEYFAPSPSVARDPGLVVFVGAMHWAPNIQAAQWLVRRALPLLRQRCPHARVAIVGRNPGPEVRALAAVEGVEVTGEVPDVRPWLWRAQAFACPMVSGTGIKNKLLEALACGTPSVATPHSRQGIRARPGEDFLLAESEAEFAETLASMLEDESLRERLSGYGRRAVREGHSWEAVARAYEDVLERAIGERRPEA